MIEVRVTESAADDARSNEIFNAVSPRDAFSNEDAQAFKRGMREADDHLGYLDGVVAGSAFTAIRADRPDVTFALVGVIEPYRGQGVGTALYEAVSTWSAARGLDTIDSFVNEDDSAGMAFAEKRSFRPIERYGRMELELAEVEPPAVDPPAGIEITTWAERDDLARGIYDVSVEAYLDMPGGADDVIEPFEDWVEHDLWSPGGSPEATFVALADGEVVGYAKLAFTAARPGIGRHEITGVKRAWRGRGIAAALKRAQIAWAKSAGYDRLVTQNEERNTPILRLNERLGFRAAPARLLMRGPLSDGA